MRLAASETTATGSTTLLMKIAFEKTISTSTSSESAAASRKFVKTCRSTARRLVT